MNYPLCIVNMCKKHLRQTMSPGKYRSIILKLLMITTGPLSVDILREILQYIEAPDELTDPNIRKIISRIQSDPDFQLEKNEKGEFLLLNKPEFVAENLFGPDDAKLFKIDTNKLVECAKNTPVLPNMNENEFIYNTFTIISNLNATSKRAFDRIPTVHFINPNDYTDSAICEFKEEENISHILHSAIIHSTNYGDDLFSDKAAKYLDKLSICYPYQSNDILLVPDISRCNETSADVKATEQISQELIIQVLQKGDGMVLMLAKAFENECATVSAFIQHIYNLANMLPNEYNVESEPWFLILQLLEKYGDTPTAKIHLLLKTLATKSNVSALTSYNQAVNNEITNYRKRMYNLLLDKYAPLSDDFTKETGLPTGQMLILDSPVNIIKDLPLLFPCDLSADVISTCFKNLGIKAWSIPSFYEAWPPHTRPVTYKSNQNLSDRLYLRNSMNFNGFTVSIENISADMGGLLRTIHYLSRPYNGIHNTVLIALISDDYMLANGQHLFESDALYRKNASTAQDTTQSSEQEKLLQVLYSEDYIVKGNYKYLQIFTSDILFLTYSQFEEAKHARVYPWIYNYETEEFMLRGR